MIENQNPAATEWAAGIPSAADASAALHKPFDDVPQFDAAADPEVDTSLRLQGDRAMIRRPSRRLFIDYRSNMDAYAHMAHLPASGESLHGVISGKYAIAELIPALIERTGQAIEDLHIATLSYNKQNAADILQLLDDGHIRRVSLVISYYFKSTSREIYDMLVPQLRERGQRVLAMRNHAKLLLAKMAGTGTTYVVETSANLRSSVNTEILVLSQDDALYAFHRGWLEELLRTQKDL